MILIHPCSSILDNERPIGNEQRRMLKRAKISCFMAEKFKCLW